MRIQHRQIVLFQGDSITDAGRDREDPSHLGYGYANFVAAWLTAKFPQLRMTFFNRGISGSRVVDLKTRWQVDCLELKPDWVSILIGINDTWRRFDSGIITTTTEFEENYRLILQQTNENLNANLIICEPFLLPYPDDRVAWREDLDPKINAVRRLAREFNAIYIPLDGLFASVVTQQDIKVWLPDGVHPTQAGHALIAQRWLAAVEGD